MKGIIQNIFTIGSDRIASVKTNETDYAKAFGTKLFKGKMRVGQAVIVDVESMEVLPTPPYQKRSKE